MTFDQQGVPETDSLFLVGQLDRVCKIERLKHANGRAQKVLDTTRWSQVMGVVARDLSNLKFGSNYYESVFRLLISNWLLYFGIIN